MIGAPSFARAALVVGVVAFVAALIGLWHEPAIAFASYLYAYFFWLDVSLGALAIGMIQPLTGGRWGDVVCAPLDAAARLLPLLAVLAAPLLFGLSVLYPWWPADAFADKRWYLNHAFFFLRAAVYFMVWILLAYRVVWLRAACATAPAAERRRRANIVGVLLYAFTVTFAAIDWIMSLMPEFYSTTFGLLVGTGQFLAGMAFGIVVAALRIGTAPRPEVRDRFNDLGNLLLTFVLTWVYIAFTQYLIIWSGDLSEDISWYLPRRQGGYEWIAIALVLFHFAVPFAVLLLRTAKRNPVWLAGVAVLVLVAHALDAYWLIVPSVRRANAFLAWTDIAAFLGIGGLWLAAFAGRLHDVEPLRPPQLASTMS